MNKKNEYQDEGLKGNERIEDAIFALQKEATQEQLAHTLTVIRRRMKEGGQLIVAVEPDPAQAQMKLQTVRTPDGKIWWSAFTSFEEELKGADQVKSTFLSRESAGCLKAAPYCAGDRRDYYQSRGTGQCMLG